MKIRKTLLAITCSSLLALGLGGCSTSIDDLLSSDKPLEGDEMRAVYAHIFGLDGSKKAQAKTTKTTKSNLNVDNLPTEQWPECELRRAYLLKDTSDLDKCKLTSIINNRPHEMFTTIEGVERSALDIKYGKNKVGRVETQVPYRDGRISGVMVQTLYDMDKNKIREIRASFQNGLLDGQYTTYNFVEQNGELTKQVKDESYWVKGIRSNALEELKTYISKEDYETLMQPFPKVCESEADKQKGCILYVDHENNAKTADILGYFQRVILYKNGKEDLNFSIPQVAYSTAFFYYVLGEKSSDGLYNKQEPLLGLDDFLGKSTLVFRRQNNEIGSIDRWMFENFINDSKLYYVLVNGKFIFRKDFYQSYTKPLYEDL